MPFVQQSLPLFASSAQLAGKGINQNGPLNLSPTSKEIPFEIVDATGKIAEKSLPADANAEVKKVGETIQTLANNIASGGSAGGGGGVSSQTGSSSGSTTTSNTSTRNIIGWVLMAALAIGGVALIVYLVKMAGKKKR